MQRNVLNSGEASFPNVSAVMPAATYVRHAAAVPVYSTMQNPALLRKQMQILFEENMFHIIRAFHVAGRCTDCGECSRVCPQHIPLHLLNRKFIKDIDEFYGEFQAGEDAETVGPLTAYTQEDCEPSIVMEKGGEA